MSVRQTRSLPKDIRYILHPLNVSKSKSTFSFQKTQRFPDPKSHSPNKFYNISSEKQKIGFSVPKGNRPFIQNLESIPPNRYNIKSQFQQKRHMRTSSDTFGVSRQGFYKGQQSKILVGPGDYNFPKEMGNKSFYIGQKIKPFDKGHNQGFLNTANSVNKLSTYVNEGAAVRLKTEYYPKNKFYQYDNKVPGPGACTYLMNADDQGQTKNSSFRNTLTTFGATERLKTQKPSVVGPGSQQTQSDIVLSSHSSGILSDISSSYQANITTYNTDIYLNINITNMYEDEEEQQVKDPDADLPPFRIRHSDMKIQLVKTIVRKVTALIEEALKLPDQLLEKDICLKLVEYLKDNKTDFGAGEGEWQCVIGKNMAATLNYDLHMLTFFDLTNYNYTVLVFKSG